MAQDFAPKLQTVTNIEALGAQNPQSMATLFEGLGESTLQAAAVFDRAVQNRIETEAQGLFNDLNQPYSDFAEDTPNDIRTSASRLGRLKEAYDQGKISDTAYYGQMVAGVKKLKAKYPGYGNEVDKVIQSVTGVRPANALRAAVMAEIDAQNSAASQSEKAWQSFISRKDVMENAIDYFPDLYGNPEKYADPQQRAGVQTVVAKMLAEKEKVSAMKDTLAVDKAMYDKNETMIKNNVNSYIGNSVNQSIAGLNKVMEDEFGGNLYTILNQLSTGQRSLDPMEQQQFIGKIRMQRDSLFGKLQAEIAAGTNGFMRPTEIKEQVTAAMASYDNMISAMQAGQWDVAGMHSRAIKNMQERDLWGMMQAEPNFRVFNSLKEISPEMAQTYWQDPGSGINKTITALGMEGVNYQGQSMEEFIKSVKNSQKFNDSEKAQGLRSSLKAMSTQLGDPNGDVAQWAEVFDNVYTDGNVFQHLGRQSQIDVYKQFTNPKITQRVASSGDQGMIQKYAGWAYSQLSKLGDVRQMASDTRQDFSNTAGFMKAGVSKDGSIDFVVDVDAYEAWAKTASVRAQANMRQTIQDSVKNLDELNSIFSNLKPIIEATGENPEAIVPMIMNNLNLQLNSGGKSFLQHFYEMDPLDKLTATGGPIGEEAAANNTKGLREFLSSRPELQGGGGDSKLGGSSGNDSLGVDVARALMRDFGLSAGAAAGFAGNLAHESGGFKTLQEINPMVKGSRGGYGWAQWTGPRRRAFEAWAKDNNLDPASPEANYGFLKHELAGPEGRVLKSLRGVNDPNEAADIVSKTFLRPGIPHNASRRRWSNKIYSSLA